jgi:hypothetical protein
MTIEKVLENLREIENIEVSEIRDEIICAFEDYSFEGVSEIMVTTPDSSKPNHLNAYANHADAPIIAIDLDENDDGSVTVKDAYIA